jgi:hypothetical protein
MSRLDVARNLAALGYFPFPCHLKRPIVATGFKAATRDERAILHAWTTHPHADIGIACGASGIAVVDIDAKHGADPAEAVVTLGLANIDLVIAWTGEAPEPDERHPRSLAGVRGAHAYFRGRARTGGLAVPGCELRADGAYVVAPPSGHESGVPYTWHGRAMPPPVECLPTLPAHLAPAANADAVPPVGQVIPAGRRHDGLKAIAIALVRRGVVEEDLLRGALRGANGSRCTPPIEHLNEVDAIARWAAHSDIASRERTVAQLPTGPWWARPPQEVKR